MLRQRCGRLLLLGLLRLLPYEVIVDLLGSFYPIRGLLRGVRWRR